MASDFKSIKQYIDPIRKSLIPPIHPAGWPFIVGFAFATILFSFVWDVFGAIGLILTIWCFYFFRQPLRQTPVREGLIISPASGTVSHIVPDTVLPPQLDKADNKENSFTRVSIFLNVFDVHVNRFPIQGKVKQKKYREGAFVNAAFDKASEENEQAAILLETEYKTKSYEMAVVQIAGWVARRIICEAEAEKAYDTGDVFGIIRFGSRVDIYLPKGIQPLVSIGQTMIDGETIIADFASKEKPRETVQK
jgi:phosphatidylserine decarboxylase